MTLHAYRRGGSTKVNRDIHDELAFEYTITFFNTNFFLLSPGEFNTIVGATASCIFDEALANLFFFM